MLSVAFKCVTPCQACLPRGFLQHLAAAVAGLSRLGRPAPSEPPVLCSSDNVNAYCLHIAEDDGEVDTDFPPLDSNEPIHKFGFSTLALVEKYSSPGLAAKQSLFVRM